MKKLMIILIIFISGVFLHGCSDGFVTTGVTFGPGYYYDAYPYYYYGPYNYGPTFHYDYHHHFDGHDHHDGYYHHY